VVDRSGGTAKLFVDGNEDTDVGVVRTDFLNQGTASGVSRIILFVEHSLLRAPWPKFERTYVRC
jgi:hypothetical protein